MGNISVVGYDVAKHWHHFCAGTANGRVLFRKKVYRSDVLDFVSKLPKCTIAMEVCGSSNYWAREFQKMGHEVKLIAPQFVKPYWKSNKNDHADAEAIMEACLRPTMRFVSVKTVEQQDIQSVHRVRQQLIKQRTALANEIRSLLSEYGVVMSKGITQVRRGLWEVLEKNDHLLTAAMKELIREIHEDFCRVDGRIAKIDQRLEQYAKAHPVCSRLIKKIAGIGPIGATAVVSYVGDPHCFRRGREMSAYFGLVPRQCTTGGKPKLGGISKRGDKYIRQLLIHGARSVLLACKKKTDPKSQWLKSLWERRGFNRTCVALANKNARILWALMAQDEKAQQIAA